MPNISAEIPDTYSAITRPITVDVVRQLIKLMGLPEDTGVQFFGAMDTQYQHGSTLTPVKEPNKFPFTGRINVEATENYIEDRTLTTAVKRRDARPFFLDTKLDVLCKPVYVGTEVTVSFRYRAPDRVTAERWRDEFRIRSGQGRTELLHEVNYHYGVPPAFMVILGEIFNMREAVAPYGDDQATWLKQCISNRATTLTTQAGTQPVLVIGEHQIGIVGWFDFLAQPEKGDKTDAGSAAWETGFDYKFVYDKVVACVMTYPLVIHNQLLDEKFRPEEPIYELAQRRRHPSLTRVLLDAFTPLYPRPTGLLSGVRVPVFDDWLPAWTAPESSSVITTLVGVNVDDPYEVISLLELGDFEFDADILNFLKGEHRWLNSLYQSVFHLSLYKWKEPISDGSLHIDAELNVRTVSPMDPRDHHHLRIGLVTDLTRLTPPTLERLRGSGVAGVKILKALEPRLKDPVLVGGKLIPRDYLHEAIDHINNAFKKNPGTIEKQIKTVGQYTIIAKREPLNASD